MENLIELHENDKSIIEGIKELNLIKEHPQFKVGQVISFIGGYNNNIIYKSKIVGFDKEQNIYVLWDCYWFPIKNETKRNIKLLKN